MVGTQEVAAESGMTIIGTVVQDTPVGAQALSRPDMTVGAAVAVTTGQIAVHRFASIIMTLTPGAA